MRRLRAQIETMEGRKAEPVYPVPDLLAPLLPDGGLKPGSAYCLASAGALLLSLLAPSSREGLWCGLVGLPELGAEAAGLAGVSLDRLVLIPHPGEHWLPAVSVLSSAVPIVVVRPASRIGAAAAARLASRMRGNGSVLVAIGDWPGAEATIQVEDPDWRGLGQGWGRLCERQATVTVASKRHASPRRVRVLLPGTDGCWGMAPPDQKDGSWETGRPRVVGPRPVPDDLSQTGQSVIGEDLAEPYEPSGLRMAVR